MKKYIYNFIILFIMFFGLTSIVSAQEDISITISSTGELTTTGSFTNVNEWLKYENNTLYLYKADNGKSFDYYYMSINLNKDVKIVPSEGVHIGRITTNSDLEFNTDNKDYTYIVESIIGNSSNDLYINNTNINDNIEVTGSIAYFDNVYIENSYVCRNAFNNHSSLTMNHGNIGLVMKDSEATFSQLYLYGDKFDLDNSTLNVSSTISVYANASVKDSTINGNSGFGIGVTRNNNGSPSYFGNNNLFENSIINVRSYSTDADGYGNVNTFRNCNINIETDISNSNFKLYDTDLNAKDIRNSSIIAENGKIKIDKISSMYFLNLKDSSFETTSDDSVYMENCYGVSMNYRDYNIKLDNSTFKTRQKIYTFNVYIKDSTVEFADLVYSSSSNQDVYTNNMIFVSDNSNITIGSLEPRGNITLNDTIMNADRIKIQDIDYNGTIDGNLIMNNSKLYVNTEEDDGIIINDLEFTNSYLLSRANTNAWISDSDITTHNLVGINETKNIMPMEGSSDTYSFYDNNNISNYVEIRTPLKVTFKIKNGTWKDGTTEDKIVESYFFGSINEVDVPKEMIASNGYENGSWDKQIVYDELKDEYVYTYEFKPKGTQPEKKESPKKEDKKEEKKENKKETKVFKNPNTGAFLSLTTIGILSAICIKILKYTRKNKIFNKL